HLHREGTPEATFGRAGPRPMKKWQLVIVVLLALFIGYGAGYFTRRIRFAYQEASLTPLPPQPRYRHPLIAQIEAARQLRTAGKLPEAQKLLYNQLRLYPQAEEARAARELLGSVNTELFSSNKSIYGKVEYVVERGDSLARIAHKLNSTPAMIMRSNNLDSTLIHPGDRLLVPDGEFTLTIDLPKERVVVHHGDGFFKQYPIQSVELPRSSQPSTVTKVTATVFWKDGERIAADAAETSEATPWIHLARPGYILYGVSEESGVEGDAVEVSEEGTSNPRETASVSPSPSADTPPHGIALLKDDLLELELFLRRGTPVTIIRDRK
nr:LysM peptidoglycan-binding domain-containing protein [Verrucomicrobiota bacterium]